LHHQPNNTFSTRWFSHRTAIGEIFAEHLAAFRKSLKGRDIDIFDARLVAETPLTLQEIGDKYGISRERARQLEARILEKLRAYVDSRGLLDAEVIKK